MRHIVLIHGAWQGAWAFEAWRPLLQAAGWQTHAIDLPGNGAHEAGRADLDGYTDHVLQHLEALDAPAVVVGHSGGGITASQVAERAPQRVAALVYLAGMMLPHGMSFAQLVRVCRADYPAFSSGRVEPALQWNAARSASSVPAAVARELFLHDCQVVASERAAARLVPQPESGRAMTHQLRPARFGRVPRIYVECLQDRSVILPLQRRMQALQPGALRISLDCGHVPQLACPQALTAALLPELERTAAAPSAPLSVPPFPHSRTAPQGAPS